MLLWMVIAPIAEADRGDILFLMTSRLILSQPMMLTVISGRRVKAQVPF